MAYSKSLAARVRQLLASRRGVTEKRMFGGVAFLLAGNMLVGIWEDAVIARLGIDAARSALDEPYVQPFNVAGRPMRGWVLVEADGLESDRALSVWIERSIDFVATLPAKPAKKKG